MAIILSIETSTPTCSIAVHKDNELLAKISINRAQSHSSVLNPSIEAILKFCDLNLTDLSAVAISKGPGSYTGLRIGTSTAKGLCFSLCIPLIGINTLEALAKQVTGINISGSWLCPMLDARRMEVYTMLLTPELERLVDTHPLILDHESFYSQLDSQSILFFGNGSNKFQTMIDHPNAHFINNVFPNAQNIGELASERFEKEEFEDLAYFEPFYLKEFKATKPKTAI
ncbi:MAG TPA: tRNA (adenosine(37)-N6)-threonylcarbamoyltransferase complex dimerization subunit type 1 TsaB [Fulvivirga sp.]|nr:tRNA (adenosine(37)-N6)-threonylcarbamoyltransferase complex dimerization subunit type 1 TsaB [Fulvivirga sp.]